MKNSNCFEVAILVVYSQKQVSAEIEQKDGADTHKGSSPFSLHFYLINNGCFPVDVIVVLKTNKHWGCNSIS